MTSHITNGYLFQQIKDGTKDDSPNHASARKYITKFRALEQHFFEKIHPFVDVGLAIDSAKSHKDGQPPDIMTIHGCRHVSDLIESLDKIAQSMNNRRGATPITPLEAYLLLCAAHLHDAGNIAGRKDHPSRSGDLIKDHMDLFYSTEIRQNIFDITRVHSGTSKKFGNDTIREISGDNFATPRLRLLAAVLRIADELSENPERVPGPLLKWFKTSPNSQFAYRYAQAFCSFVLQNDTLDIQLRVYPEQHQYSQGLDGKKRGFFDHLERKIDVIEREIRYCSQYGRPDFDVRRIRIAMNYHRDAFPSQPTNSATLTLNLDHGYPDLSGPLSVRCNELNGSASLESFFRGTK